MKISNSDTSQSTVSTDTSTVQANLSPTIFYNLILQMMSEPPQAQAPELSQSSQAAQPSSQAELVKTAAMPVKVEETLPQTMSQSLDVLDDHPVMSQLNFMQQALPLTTGNDLPAQKTAEDKMKLNALANIPLPAAMPENILPKTIPLAMPLVPPSENDTEKNMPQYSVPNESLAKVLLPDLLMTANVSPSKSVNPTVNTNTAAKKIPQPVSAKMSNPLPMEGIFSTKSQLMDSAASSLGAVEMIQSPSLNKAQAQPMPQDKNHQPQNPLAMHAFTQLSHFIHNYTLPSGMMPSSSSAATGTVGETVSLPQQSMTSRYEPQIEVMASSVGPFLKESYDAKIKIYPPDLGSVLAKLKIEKGSAQLVLLTENNRVKEIVEANLPQLHQQFKEADISLTQVQVQSSLADFTDQASQESHHFAPEMGKENTETKEQQVISANESPKDPNQIIDTYA